MAQVNPRLYNFFMENVELRISDGNRVKFWVDVWLGSSSLKSLFPRLYQLTSDKEISLNLQLSCRDSTNTWCFHFRRPLLEWEKDKVIRLQSMLREGPGLYFNKKDLIRRKAQQSGISGWWCV